jgi:hypothetical protein
MNTFLLQKMILSVFLLLFASALCQSHFLGGVEEKIRIALTPDLDEISFPDGSVIDYANDKWIPAYLEKIKKHAISEEDYEAAGRAMQHIFPQKEEEFKISWEKDNQYIRAMNYQGNKEYYYNRGVREYVKTLIPELHYDLSPPHSQTRNKTQIMYMDESVPPQYGGHAIEGLLFAYNHHLALKFSPDDLWMFVTLMYSKYVNDNADEMHDLFVAHEGKKKLKVVHQTIVPDFSLFFHDMLQQIQGSVVKQDDTSIVMALTPEFTTTGPINQRLNAIAVMDSMKHYFDYEYAIFLCGFPAVEFMGVVEDYYAMARQIQLLHDGYVKHQEMKDKLMRFKDVIQKFIDTMEGRASLKWWRQAIDIVREHVGSGGQYNDMVSGWILHLFGLSEPTPIPDIVTNDIMVPVKFKDEIKGEQHDTHILGGFYGWHVQERTVRLSINMVVLGDMTTLER